MDKRPKNPFSYEDNLYCHNNNTNSHCKRRRDTHNNKKYDKYSSDCFDVKHCYVHTGSRCRKGPRGHRGRKGCVGPTGSRGQRGRKGYVGPTAPTGNTGDTVCRRRRTVST